MENEEIRNEIDMEIDPSLLDDDDSFGMVSTKSNNKNNEAASNSTTYEGSDGRIIDKYVGYCADFSDDDETPTKVIKAEIVNNGTINIVCDGEDTAKTLAGNLNGINEIDMECNCCEDEDDEDYVKEDITLDEEGVEESRKNSAYTSGNVSPEYYNELKKKHAKTNVKGAYNTSFHIGGNPEAEMSMFNHAMGTEGATAANVGFSVSGGFGEELEEEACPQETTPEPDYKAAFKELLKLIGFELNKNEDNTYCLKDIYNIVGDKICKDSEEVITSINPYIQDYVLAPMELTTREEAKTYAGWCNWYNEEKQKQFPKLSNDIKYCVLLTDLIDKKLEL